MELFKSELERIWKRKLTWLAFILIPLAIAGASKYYLGNNFRHPVTSPEFISFGNYPFMVFQEMLVSLFNVMVILFVCTSITEEYRKGELRMVMIRGFSFGEIYLAKVASIITTMFIFFVTFFTVSTVWGYFTASKLVNVKLFYYSKSVTIPEALLYSAKYYAVGFLTIIAILFVFTLIAILCKTSTGVIGACITFLLGSFIFSETILQCANMLIKNVGQNSDLIVIIEKLYLITIPKIQHVGICFILAEKPILDGWIFSVLIAYIILLGSIACIVFTREDHFI